MFYISVYGIIILSMSQNRNFKYSFSLIPWILLLTPQKYLLTGFPPLHPH